jgi:hypothetical protein
MFFSTLCLSKNILVNEEMGGGGILSKTFTLSLSLSLSRVFQKH